MTVVADTAGQEKAEQFLKWRGSRILVATLQNFEHKRLLACWNKWHGEMMKQKYKEQHAAVTEINRIVRGFLGQWLALVACHGRHRRPVGAL